MILLFAACAGSADPAPDTAPPSDTPRDTARDTGLDTDLPCFADADLDGYGDPAVPAPYCAGTSVTNSGDCDDATYTIHPGADEACDGIDLDCDGSASTEPGAGAGCPAASCLEALETRGTATDGAYWLALPSGATAEVWCDMTTDGGGWTLGLLTTSAGAGIHTGFGGSELAPEDLGVSPETATSAGTPILSWLDLEPMDWSELHVAAYSSGAATYTSRDIARDVIRIPFGSDGYYLYGDAGYYWCGGAAAYTDSGVGATSNPVGAPPDCKGHGSLGSGWDFSESPGANAGLTLCGSDASNCLATQWGGSWLYYPTPGGAQAIWIR